MPVGKFTKTDIVATRFARSISIFCKEQYVLILIFACTYVGGDSAANLQAVTGYKEIMQLIPKMEGLERKEPEYFWQQEELQSRENARTYDETVEPIHQGMQNERESKERDFYEETEYQNWENSTESNVLDRGSYHAMHETVDDRDTPAILAGKSRPCAGKKVCARREESQALMIESLKRNILLQLKMKEPPNITASSISYDSPPMKRLIKRHGMKLNRYMEELEEESEDLEYENDETTKETIISPARELNHPGANGSYFTFNDADLRYTVTKAEIWFYVKANPTNRTNLTLEFYRYQKNSTHPDAPLVAQIFDRVPIHAHRVGHWKDHVITHEVSRWFMHPDTNFGIDIRCPRVPGLVMSRPTAEHEDKKPTLEVRLTHNTRSRRRKRDADLRCQPDSSETRCCRYSFSVSFAKLGWHWIISPLKYNSFFCSGECSVMFLQSNQKRMLALAPATLAASASKPCCAPIKMDKISMLYFDNYNNVVYSDVPDMVVKKCGCM